MKSVGSKIDTTLELDVVLNGSTQRKKLAELLTLPTVISIYMRNNTSSCDKQNSSLVEHSQAIAAKGWQVLAVSRDTCNSHGKYATKMGIGYILASDPNDVLAKELDAIVEKSMYGKKYMGPARAAFFISKDGTIRDVIEKIDSKQHGEEVLARL
ncbi:MAG: redoxin domain-containing protein [Verrucomicrobia bacterium]|nr:redoxin domain-containing protein [Verrucomicrobiota bacterium]